MPIVALAIASMVATIACAALAGWLYQPIDRKMPERLQSANVWVAVFALLAGILCILSAFLWFRYLVIDHARHLGESFD